MRFFSETHIDFLGKRSLGFAVSAALLAVSVGSLILAGGPRLGIDFAGGSQIVVRFAQAPDLGALRDALTTAGLPEVTLQEFEAGSNEVLIRAPGAVTEGSEIDAAVAAVTAALADIYGSEDDALDINMAGQDQVLALLLRANPLEFDLDLDLEAAQAAYREGVDAIYAAKAQQGLLTTWDGFRADTADERVLSAVRDGTRLGSYAVVDSQSVGAAGRAGVAPSDGAGDHLGAGGTARVHHVPLPVPFRCRGRGRARARRPRGRRRFLAQRP